MGRQLHVYTLIRGSECENGNGEGIRDEQDDHKPKENVVAEISVTEVPWEVERGDGPAPLLSLAGPIQAAEDRKREMSLGGWEGRQVVFT